MEYTAEFLLKPEWLATYKRRHHTLMHELTRLNCELLLLKKIGTFPFRLFYPSGHQFWSLAGDALYRSAVLRIHALALDRDKRSLSLLEFSRQILENAKDEQARTEISSRLNQVKVEESFGEVRKRLATLRNKNIAHFDPTVEGDEHQLRTIIPIVYWNELRRCVDALSIFFQELGLGVHSALYYMPYGHEEMGFLGQAPELDIDQLLDVTAEASYMCTGPDTHPEVWAITREKLGGDEIEVVNRYRRRLGRPEVS
jgi:hypothetical protein